jgi:hypothetical protein
MIIGNDNINEEKIITDEQIETSLGGTKRVVKYLNDDNETIVYVETIELSVAEINLQKQLLLAQMKEALIEQVSYTEFDLSIPQELTDKITNLKSQMTLLIGGQ